MNLPVLFAKKSTPAMILMALAVVYGFLSNFHTLQEFDLGWQLASGRWVLAHHEIPSTDVFSYTARGLEWIYPVGSGLVLYALYLLGGYTVLSWFGAAFSAGTLAVLASGRCIIRSALAVIAVPLIAYRTEPRADMFTTLFFAIFLSVLWMHHRTGQSPLWLLPSLMILWVNLHLGFSAGIALCVAYVLLELLEFPYGKRRPLALSRLCSAWPWLLMTGVATVINPWGPYIYAALIRQGRVLQIHSSWIAEWARIPVSWTNAATALSWREPESALWWLFIAALVAVGLAVWQKHLGAVVLLTTSAYLAVQHARFQNLFACVVVIVGGSMLNQYHGGYWHRMRDIKVAWGRQSLRLGPASAVCLVGISGSLVGIRSSDLITNRHYLRSSNLSVFGAGLSWWYPERAVEFLKREHLPSNLFNAYDMGGYLTWRLPEYPDYIDGRAVPFGGAHFFRAYDLTVEPPESDVWRREADSREIKTIIVSLARYEGVELFPRLSEFCNSQTWRPVYMDEVSAIFVRWRPETATLIDRLSIDCSRVTFSLPSNWAGEQSFRKRAERFTFWANAAALLHGLGRNLEALEDIEHAQGIFGESANLHLIRALVLRDIGRTDEAEKELRTSIRLEPGDENWFELGRVYAARKRFSEARGAFLHSAELSSRPHDMWLMVGQVYLQTAQPYQALQALEHAIHLSPFVGEAEPLGSGFYAQIAAARAVAWWQLGDLRRATEFQEESTKLRPENAKFWDGLAELYQAQGQTVQAQQALVHVREPHNHGQQGIQ